MKKNRILNVIVIVMLLTTFLASGCGVILIPDNEETPGGEIETRQYNFTEFTRIAIRSDFTYEIKQADTYSISITADRNVLEDLRVTKEGQTLDIGIGFPGVASTFKLDSNRKVVITMPELQGLDSTGATYGTITGFKSDEDLDITVSRASTVELDDIAAGDSIFDVSGGSTVKIRDLYVGDITFIIDRDNEVTGDIKAKDMDLKVSKSSEIQLKGLADNLTINGSGDSHIKLSGLEVENANVTLSGASEATINLTGSLNYDLRTGASLEYIGEPTFGSIMNMTGDSTVKRK